MTNILIRGVDDEVVDRLKRKAAADGKSLNNLLHERVTQFANEPTDAELRQRFGELARLELSNTEIVELVGSARR